MRLALCRPIGNAVEKFKNALPRREALNVTIPDLAKAVPHLWLIDDHPRQPITGEDYGSDADGNFLRTQGAGRWLS